MSSSQPTFPDERRGALRRRLGRYASVVPAYGTDLDSATAVIEDVSPHGVRLRTAEPCQEGESLDVFVEDGDRPLHARVVWSHAGPAEGTERAWVTGCSLSEPYVPDARQLLSRPPSEPTPVRWEESWWVRGLMTLLMLGIAGLVIYAIFWLVLMMGRLAMKMSWGT